MQEVAANIQQSHVYMQDVTVCILIDQHRMKLAVDTVDLVCQTAVQIQRQNKPTNEQIKHIHIIQKLRQCLS